MTDCQQQKIPDEEDVKEATSHINHLIDTNIANGVERRIIAGFIRLAFHYCVGAGNPIVLNYTFLVAFHVIFYFLSK